MRLRTIRARALAWCNAPPLTRRFALYAAAVLAIAVTATFFVIRHETIARAEQTASAHAQFIAQSILHDQLRPDDLRSPVTPARRSALDQVFRREILLDGAVLATVYGADGRVTYSTDHALIGQAAGAASQIGAAQHGALVHYSTTLSAQDRPAGALKVLETDAPLALSSRSPAGAFALAQDYSAISASADRSAVELTALVTLILLGLYLSYFPILGRVTARMRTKMQNAEHGLGQMEHQAFHDPLTGLPNRTLFRDRVELALHAARRNGSTVALMVMDLDRFKEINDTFGHESGDELLREVAANLCGPLRDGDTVSRLGGDEFAILAPTVAGPLGAMAIAERAVRELDQLHSVAGVEVDVAASIGIALYPHHGDAVDELLRCADIAMYVSKKSGAPRLYAIEHDHSSRERLALGAQLRRAIAQREITLYYQPKADFKTGAVNSVEALVRWDHAERGLLLPGEFVPLAEHTGLMRALTSHVLDTALEQCRRWRDAGLEIAVAVNIAGQDLLDQQFAYEVRDCLQKWELNPACLELEITENTVLVDPIRARSVLMALGDFGVRLTIDDFGTGNSSLAYLKRLPVSGLKIDKSFVLKMLSDEDDAVIVRSTIELGHNLGLQVVAEGIESAAIWDRLRHLGCDVGQGYYLSAPLPAATVGKLLANMPRASARRVRPLALAAGPTRRTEAARAAAGG